jgi:hypothetical protein
MFRFVTIIPIELWAIVLLLLFMWAAFGLNGFIITVLGLALLHLGLSDDDCDHLTTAIVI